jgi:hypothetical protein
MLRLTPSTTTLGLSGLPLNFAVAFIATCAFWLFGYDMSVMVGSQQTPFAPLLSKLHQGGVITEEPFLSVFPETRNPSTLGIVIASFELGALVGAPIMPRPG